MEEVFQLGKGGRGGGGREDFREKNEKAGGNFKKAPFLIEIFMEFFVLVFLLSELDLYF